jgi:hypothetical protein
LFILAAARGYHFFSDFDQLWIAARALRNGGDPYAAVLEAHLGAGFPLYYPLPAVLLVLPLTPLSLGAARSIFAICCGAVAGFGLQRLGLHGLLALASAAFLAATVQGQLAPALAGAALVPSLGFLLATKPTLGLALWCWRPSRLAAILAVAITVVSVVLWPAWPGAWLEAVRNAPHIRAPVLRPWGWSLLLAGLRWRRPEGRLLLAWACIPRTEVIYDLMPLFLVAGTMAEAGLLVVASWATLLGQALVAGSSGDLLSAEGARWPVVLLLFYLPALVLVLARTPKTEPASAGPT